MTLSAIIDAIADEADDILDGVKNHNEARAAISEQITIKYSTLSGPERTKVIDGVLSVLAEEGFFELGSSSESEDEAETEEE
jgi:hypothetical protein